MCSGFHLKGKNIIITGASSGIGKQCAITISQFGANVILIGRDKEKLNKTFKSLSKGNHLWFSQDITHFDKLEIIIKETVQKVGKISGFIHSAGIEIIRPFKITNSNHYKELFDINAISGFEIARLITKKKYLDENNASFIFISSIMGLLGEAGRVAYCSSKGAIVSGCRALALELACKKIRVNCICPGLVKTEMLERIFHTISDQSIENIISKHPLGLGYPEDIAYACVFLLSDTSRWITGTSLVIDGGYSIS